MADYPPAHTPVQATRAQKLVPRPRAAQTPQRSPRVAPPLTVTRHVLQPGTSPRPVKQPETKR